MERWEAKLISLFGMFAVIFVCMALPIKVSVLIARQGENAGYILGLLRCFAGGVFVGTIMLHMIPEVHDQIQEFLLEPRGIDYPVSEVVLIGGFFLILLLERLILSLHARNKEDSMENVALTSQVMLGTHIASHNGTPCALNEVLDDAVVEGSQNRAFTPTCTPQNHRKAEETKMGVTAMVNNITLHQKMANGFTAMENGGPAVAAVPVFAEPASPVKEDLVDGMEDASMSRTRSLILVLALSFECIFDGLSVGLQLTQTSTWNMFIAIVSHEFIISFCLGLELVKFHSNKKVLLVSFFYALLPPIGCGIGMILTEVDIEVDEDTLEIVSGLLIAVSAGIFLYCTFIGMLGEELIQDATLAKILVTAIGCAIMAGLAALPDDVTEESEDVVLTTSAMATDLFTDM